MLSDIAPILIALSALVAFVVAARTWMLWQSIAARRARVHQRLETIERAPRRVRRSSDAFRGKLVEVNAGIERSLWSLARFDDRADEMEGSLRARRVQLDEFRSGQLGSARRGLANVRRTVRVLKQLMELRRTFLG